MLILFDQATPVPIGPYLEGHTVRTAAQQGWDKLRNGDLLLNHWEKLTLFLQVPGAPLDNSIAERALKKAILHRKELAVLQEPEWGADGRPVHEPDSHLRVKRSES